MHQHSSLRRSCLASPATERRGSETPPYIPALGGLMLTFLLLVGSAIAATPTLAPLPAALRGKEPVSVLPADLAATMKAQDHSKETPAPAFSWSAPSATPRTLRVETFTRPNNPASIAARWSIPHAGRRGDVLLARFYARAEYARQESGEAIFQFSIEQAEPEFARHVLLPLSAGPEWGLFEVPVVLARDSQAGQVEVTFGFGTIPQAMEITGLEIVNFGNRAQVSELPQTRFTYAGREADAAWRKAALERIEEHRTAPMKIRVLDAAAKPVPGARVQVRLARPQFLFGTEVNAATLLAKSADADRYRTTLLELFDTAVLGNALKWPSWSASVEKREEALRATDWMEANKLRIRGHNLVWPGDKFSPRRIVALPAPKAELGLLIKEHIQDLMTTMRGRIVGWDVINELMHERDYLKYLPESEAAEWFKLARALDPTTKLFLNEYAMLNSRKSPENIARFLELAGRLRAHGAPIDGLGIQGHVGRQVRNPVDVLADLDVLATAGLELQITEFDVNTPDEELQADYTRDFLIALYSHPAVTGFTMWGFWQKQHWKPDAALFRADWSEKPNARVWRELVTKQWRTKADVTAGNDGVAEVRGHLGDYEFIVTAGERTVRQMRTLTKAGGEFTMQVP